MPPSGEGQTDSCVCSAVWAAVRGVWSETLQNVPYVKPIKDPEVFHPGKPPTHGTVDLSVSMKWDAGNDSNCYLPSNISISSA